MTHSEFLADRFGSTKWVLARNTARIREKYYDSVVVSRTRYAAVEKEWRVLYGDPYDKVRAEMYQALLAAREWWHSDARNITRAEPEWLGKARAAIKSEQDAR